MRTEDISSLAWLAFDSYVNFRIDMSGRISTLIPRILISIMLLPDQKSIVKCMGRSMRYSLRYLQVELWPVLDAFFVKSARPPASLVSMLVDQLYSTPILRLVN